jgi:uncharacterized protein YbcI
MPTTITKGQIEAAACGTVNQFLRDQVGRGATTISAVCHRDLMVVHLGGVLTRLEKSLTATSDEEGHLGLARSMRNHLVTKSLRELTAAFAAATGFRPSSILHDFDDRSGDEVFIFRFDEGTASKCWDCRST